MKFQYGIKLYCRFKDDILIIGSESLAAYSFGVRLQNQCPEFQLELDSMSLSHINMLDMQFFKGPGWKATGVLDSKVVWKGHISGGSVGAALSPSLPGAQMAVRGGREIVSLLIVLGVLRHGAGGPHPAPSAVWLR